MSSVVVVIVCLICFCVGILTGIVISEANAEKIINKIVTDKKIDDVLFDIRNEIIMLHTFSQEEVIKIIDNHIKEEQFKYE